MSPVPAWLPALVLFSDYGGDWNAYVEALYTYFRQDFLNTRPSLQGTRIGVKRRPIEKGKEATFWHLISEGKTEADRLPDMRRCERIRWPRPMIEGAPSRRSLRLWRQQRPGGLRIAIALEDFSYVVILAQRRNYLLLWTAFCVEEERRKTRLKKEYDASQNKAGAAPERATP